MRIAYFAECMTPGQDGVSRVLHRVAAFNRAQGHAACWVTAIAAPGLPEPQLLTRSLPLPGYAPYRLSVPGARGLWTRLATFRPDVLHLHAPFFLGWTAARLARRLGVPCVATYHTDFIGYVRYYGGHFLIPLLRWHNRLVYNACAVTLVPSRTMQRTLQAEGIRNTRVLPHGVDTAAFHPRFHSAAWRRAFGAEKCILLCVGRLVWEKNLALLAQALPALLARFPQVVLVFVGTGPAREALQRQLPQAHFLGYLAGNALATAYASSDALVFPSATETFGNVTLEAMASGLPCLVADAGGSADLVEHGVTGLRFVPTSADSLTEQMSELVGNASQRQRMGQQALAYAQTQDWDRVLGQQQAIYDELIASQALKTGREPPRAALPGSRWPRRPAELAAIVGGLAGWSSPS